MQRVRIGLTGLAGVFLLVLAAAAFFGLARHETDAAPIGAPAHSNASGGTGNEEAPKEPLAELGVTPGNLPDKDEPATASQTPRTAPPPAPARR